MMTWVKERKTYETIYEISKNGKITFVIAGKVNYQVTRYNEKADISFLKFLDNNYYKCVRSDKKAIQEYKGW